MRFIGVYVCVHCNEQGKSDCNFQMQFQSTLLGRNERDISNMEGVYCCIPAAFGAGI